MHIETKLPKVGTTIFTVMSQLALEHGAVNLGQGFPDFAVPDLMSQSQKLVNVWYEPIEILTATAAIYIMFVFLISLTGKLLADRLRQRYGLAAS